MGVFLLLISKCVFGLVDRGRKDGKGDCRSNAVAPDEALSFVSFFVSSLFCSC